MDEIDKKLRATYKLFKKLSLNNRKEPHKVNTLFLLNNLHIDSIELKTFKLFIEIDYQLIKINSKNIFFPINLVNYYLDNPTGIKHARDIYNSFGWFFPAFLPANPLIKISEYLLKEDRLISNVFLESILSTIYNEKYISKMYLYKYSKIRYVNKYSHIIFEAIQNFYLGFISSSIILLLPCIEGIIRDIYDLEGKKENNIGKYALLNILDSNLKKYKNDKFITIFNWIPIEFIDNKFFDSFDEYFQMLNGFKLYIDKFLFIDSRNGNDIGNLNRHKIIHGLTTEFDYPFNFIRLISLLDLLVFIISMNAQGYSCVLPMDTDESFKLSNYFTKLKPTIINLKDSEYLKYY